MCELWSASRECGRQHLCHLHMRIESARANVCDTGYRDPSDGEVSPFGMLRKGLFRDPKGWRKGVGSCEGSDAVLVALSGYLRCTLCSSESAVSEYLCIRISLQSVSLASWDVAWDKRFLVCHLARNTLTRCPQGRSGTHS